MSGLLFLTSDDFQIQRGTKGPILCTNIPGFSLILFYSTQCTYCQTLIPIFKRLPGSVGGCQFGMINVSHNKQCVLLSRQTIAPIKEVPYIVLYVNGKPYMRYRGPHDIREIGRFIVEVAEKVRTNESFAKDDKRIDQDPRKGIPEYTIGHPLYGTDDKVCYLDWEEAYTGEHIGPQHNRPRQHLPTQAGMGTTGRQDYNPNMSSGGHNPNPNSGGYGTNPSNPSVYSNQNNGYNPNNSVNTRNASGYSNYQQGHYDPSGMGGQSAEMVARSRGF
jgi:hypothetical protein